MLSTIRRGLRTLTVQHSRFLIIASTGSHSTHDELSDSSPHWEFLGRRSLLVLFSVRKTLNVAEWHSWSLWVGGGGRGSPATLNSTHQAGKLYLHIYTLNSENFTVCCVIRFNVGGKEQWIQKGLVDASEKHRNEFQVSNEKRISFPLWAENLIPSIWALFRMNMLSFRSELIIHSHNMSHGISSRWLIVTLNWCRVNTRQTSENCSLNSSNWDFLRLNYR